MSNDQLDRKVQDNLISVLSLFVVNGYSLLPTIAATFEEQAKVDEKCQQFLLGLAPCEDKMQVTDSSMVLCNLFLSPEVCPPEHIVSLYPHVMHPFFALNIPYMSINKYCSRVMYYMKCSPEALIHAMCLIQRASLKHGLPFNPRTAHRLLLTSLVVATKMRDDKYFNMTYYASLGGVSRFDLVAMELNFLKVLDFNANVSPAEYVTMLYSIRSFTDQLNRISSPTPTTTWSTIAPLLALPSATFYEVDLYPDPILLKSVASSVSMMTKQDKKTLASLLLDHSIDDEEECSTISLIKVSPLSYDDITIPNAVTAK
jgi:hypothetical protein